MAQVASAITPVPGGVGPMTITMLLRNTVQAAAAIGLVPRRPLRRALSPKALWTVAEVDAPGARQWSRAGSRPLWVRGEVSGFKAYRSGHWYFTLRDRDAQVRCVMWSRDNQRLPAPPADGMEVFAFGPPTVWEERGEFRLTARHLLSTEAGGCGSVAFEQAKAALQRDGLLDPARKRPLPPFPRRIAVVTSADGAALRDIAAVLERRWPADLVLVPTRVQGDGAEREVCAALARWRRIPRLDLASSAAAAARGRTSGPSTASASPGPSPPCPSRSSRPSVMRPT